MVGLLSDPGHQAAQALPMHVLARETPHPAASLEEPQLQHTQPPLRPPACPGTGRDQFEACSQLSLGPSTAAAPQDSAGDQLSRQLAEHNLQLPCRVDAAQLAAGEQAAQKHQPHNGRAHLAAWEQAAQRQQPHQDAAHTLPIIPCPVDHGSTCTGLSRRQPGPADTPAAEFLSGAVRCAGQPVLPGGPAQSQHLVLAGLPSFRGPRLSLSLSSDSLLLPGAATSLAQAAQQDQAGHASSAEAPAAHAQTKPQAASPGRRLQALAPALQSQLPSMHQRKGLQAQIRTSLEPGALVQARGSVEGLQAQQRQRLVGPSVCSALLGTPLQSGRAVQEPSLHRAFLGRALGSRDADADASAAAGEGWACMCHTDFAAVYLGRASIRFTGSPSSLCLLVGACHIVWAAYVLSGLEVVRSGVPAVHTGACWAGRDAPAAGAPVLVNMHRGPPSAREADACVARHCRWRRLV